MSKSVTELERAFRAALASYDRDEPVAPALDRRLGAALELVDVLVDALVEESVGASHARLRSGANVAELLVAGRWRVAFERSRSELLELAWSLKLRGGLPVGPLYTVQGGTHARPMKRVERFRVCVGAGDFPLLVIRHVPGREVESPERDTALRAFVAEAMSEAMLATSHAAAARGFSEALRRAGDDPRLQAWALCNLGGATEDQRAALAYYRRALELVERLDPSLDLSREILRDIAECSMELGLFADGERYLAQAVELLVASYGDDDLELTSYYRGLRHCAKEMGRDDEAERWREKAQKLGDRFGEPMPE